MASLFQIGGLIAVIGIFFFWRSTHDNAPIIFVLTLCTEGMVFSYWLSRAVLSKVNRQNDAALMGAISRSRETRTADAQDDGTAAMREVSDAIREGAEGFLSVQYGQIGRLAFVFTFLIAGRCVTSSSVGPS